VLNGLAEFTGGRPHEVDPDQLKHRIEAVYRELDGEKPEALFDAADERGVKLSDDEQSRVTGDEIGADPEEAAADLRNLLVVHAVYGMDPRWLSLTAAKALNKQLGQVLPEAAENAPSNVGVVAQGYTAEAPLSWFDSEDGVRDRMVLEMLPHLIDAAKVGKAPRLGDHKAFPRAGGRKG